MLLNITDFCKETGRSRPTIYKALKDGVLSFSVDKLIDTESPQVVTFLGRNRSNNGGKYSAQKSKERYDSMERGELEDERLRQQIVKLELENAVKAEDLVDRDVVHDKIITPINELFIKMISDMPRTVLLEMRQSIGAGLLDGEIEKRLKGIFESNIKRTKRELLRGLSSD